MVTIKINRKPPFFHLGEALQSVVAEAGNLMWGSAPEFKPKNINTNYDYFDNDGTIQRSVIDLAETACGQGHFTTVDEDEHAKELCDEFAQKKNLDELLPNIAKNILIAGFLPVETKINKLPSKCALKIVHPKTVSTISLDPKTAKLSHIIQRAKKMGAQNITIKEADLAWFNYNKIGNDPRGTSLIKGLVDILGYRDNAIKNMDKILGKYASPLFVWKMTGDISAFRKAIEAVEAGEDIFAGNLRDEESLKNLLQVISVDPRAKFWEYNEYLDRKIYESLGAPSLGYWRNATQASAEVLDDIVQRNVHALQRNIKRVVEAKWFGPLCEMNGCKEVPKLEWGLEKTGVEDLNISGFLEKGLEVGYVSQTQFEKLLHQMGLRIEPDEGTSEPSGAAKPPEEVPPEEEARITRATLVDVIEEVLNRYPNRFRGPRGEVGPMGEQGLQGSRGPPGESAKSNPNASKVLKKLLEKMK